MPRSQHAAVRIDDKNVFVFGGHASPTQRLNDCWILNMQNTNATEVYWQRVEGDVDTGLNE